MAGMHGGLTLQEVTNMLDLGGCGLGLSTLSYHILLTVDDLNKSPRGPVRSLAIVGSLVQ